MIKKIVSLALIILIGTPVAAVLAKDWILKTAVEMAIGGVTGFPTRVKSLKFNLPSTLHIEELEIRNPKGFEKGIFVRIPEIYVSLVLPELLQGKRTHLKEVRLNIQEVHIEKNERGVSNVELLSSVGKGGRKAPREKKVEKTPEKKPAMPFLLERLELTIRHVSFEDRSGLVGAAPIPKGASVDLNVEKEVFGNIENPAILINLILVKILQGATFGRLLNLNPEKLLGQDFKKVLSSGREILEKQAVVVKHELGEAATQAQDLVAKAEVTQKVEGALSETKSVLAEKGADVKSKVSGLLGKLKPQSE